MSRVHLLEDTKAYLQVADVVLLIEEVEPDLEVTAIVLLTLGLVSEGDYEVVHYNLLPRGIIHHGLPIVQFCIKDMSG